METEIKFCSRCREEKPLQDFSPGQRMKSGKRSWCKSCSASYGIEYYHKNFEKIRLQRQTRRKKDYGWEYHLKRTFSMSVEDYNDLLEKQSGVCAICETPSTNKKLSVDHCHTSGKIRGLLCQSCNTALGLLKDNIDYANNLIIYLRSNQ